MGAILVKKILSKLSNRHSIIKSWKRIRKIKIGGDIGLDRVIQGLVKARSELGTSKLKQKLIILTDAKSNTDHDYGYLSAA